MRTLILLRHGEAERAAASGRDADRALTAKGRGDAASAGAALAQRGAAPDLVLASPAVRTQQTWEAAGASFPGVESRTEAGLLHAGARAVLAAAEDASVDAVMVVGHNPGLGELADALSRSGGDAQALRAFAAAGFPPASAATFAQHEGAWRLEAFWSPGGSAG